MTRIVLDLTKTIDQNASEYFEKAKKARKKMKGAQEALEKSRQKLKKARKKSMKAEAAAEQITFQKPKPEWYEKFRWFISSEGFLVIGGRDATTNEMIIKKHTKSKDLVFHTDMSGSPFFVIQSDSLEGKSIGKPTIQQTADATCTFSKAFKLGLARQDVFYVKPDQVTKEAKAGEYLQKGAFMIKGKTTYVDNRINCAVGITEEGRIMAGPVEAVSKNCTSYVQIGQGDQKTSRVAKLIQKKIGGDLDDIIRAMPTGGCRIERSGSAKTLRPKKEKKSD
ncbi:DUF814 domain-containing protein [Candidatus Woesearchaeota archaeon]|nr:DUF814 domain-containing protein [Candidatus Woesearchaeota archaeon]